MTRLVVAVNARRAAEHAKREGLRGRWVAVTPDNYATVLPKLAAAREDIAWNFDGLPWGSWSLPDDMLDAIRACIHRGRE